MIANPPPMSTFKCPSYIRPPKTEAELTELGLSAAAEAVPDDVVAADPAVVAAIAAADAWTVRLKRLNEYPAKRNVILHLVADIAAELETARESYRFACLDSFLVNHHDFAGGVAAAEHVALLERRLQAAQVAKADIDRSFPELTELHDLRDRADRHLANIRFELKRQAVLASQA